MSYGWEWMMWAGLMRCRQCKETPYSRQLFPSHLVEFHI